MTGRLRSLGLLGGVRKVWGVSPEQTIDFRPILAGALYGPLQDVVVFEQVRLDPEASTLVWPNGADFDPAVLHDGPAQRMAFVTQARQWVMYHFAILFSEADAPGAEIPLRFALPPLPTCDAYPQESALVGRAGAGGPARTHPAAGAAPLRGGDGGGSPPRRGGRRPGWVSFCITRCQRGSEGDFPADGASSARAAGEETGKHFQTETLPTARPRPPLWSEAGR